MREQWFALLETLSKPAVAVGGSLVIAAGAIGGTWYLTSVSPTGNYVPVATAPITQEVDVSGTVQAAQSTDLSFQTPGQIAGIYAQVGQHVSAGQTLLSLNHATLSAQLAQANAALAAQQAKLASLEAGTRPEQLSIDQSAQSQAQTALTNATYSAYIAADDAVHNKADQFFINPRSTSPTLSFTVPDATLQNKITQDRMALEPQLVSWASQENVAASSSLPLVDSEAKNMLTQIGGFLNEVSVALAETPSSGSLSATTLAGYQTAIETGRLNVSNALSALTSSETALVTTQGNLTLAQAGATAQDIAAQQAQVASAQASVQAVQVQIAQSFLAAPIAGTVTAQNANPGETVAPGTPLVSLIADGKYEAQAQVSETDITKITRGDLVTVTFAEYPGSTFPAVVTEVTPAAQVAQGVSDYPVKVTFSAADARIVAGLTANLRIITATHPAALVIPVSAVITNGTQQFVYVQTKGAGDTKVPVTTGIESADGKVEILSGLSQGQNVLAFSAHS